MTRTLPPARWAVALFALPAALLIAAPAQAADPDPAGISLTGSGRCIAAATSFDGAGTELGSLNSESGVVASSGAPLLVARGGTVDYAGGSAKVMQGNDWTVSIAGIPVRSDTTANDDGKRTVTGTAQVDDYLPVSLTGTMLVKVDIESADAARCTASAWIKIEGNGFTSANGVAGLVLLALGLAGIALARPAMDAVGTVKTRGVLGTFAGLVAGLGLALLLISTSVIPFGAPWLPLGIVAVAGVLGGLVGKLLPARRPSTPPPVAPPTSPPPVAA